MIDQRDLADLYVHTWKQGDDVRSGLVDLEAGMTLFACVLSEKGNKDATTHHRLSRVLRVPSPDVWTIDFKFHYDPRARNRADAVMLALPSRLSRGHTLSDNPIWVEFGIITDITVSDPSEQFDKDWTILKLYDHEWNNQDGGRE